MASYIKRKNKNGGDAYTLRAFISEDATGKQKTKSKTWKPPAGMPAAKADKEAEKQAILFENEVRNAPVIYDSKVTLGEFGWEWLKNKKLAYKTRHRYEDLLRRIAEELGGIPLNKLQAHHIEGFYRKLREPGANKRDAHASSDSLNDLMKRRKLSREKLAKMAGLGTATVSAAALGRNVSIQTAKKIAKALALKMESVFTVHKSSLGLSERSIQHHHRLLSEILKSAKRNDLIPCNVAQEKVDAPKVKRKEAKYLEAEDARNYVTASQNETDLRIKTVCILLLFTGMRRGELCGLSWPDIDEEDKTIHVEGASQYQVHKGTVAVSTKTESSIRTIDVPSVVIAVLQEYREWWNAEKTKYGDAWLGEKERLFIGKKGKPINPDTINYWLDKFIKRHGLPRITPHGFRHTFVALQVSEKVDIKTIQSRTGHASVDVLLNTYAHALREYQKDAADKLENVLLSETKSA